MNSLDQLGLEAAYQQALLAESQDEVPVGAVLMLNEQIVATGYNQKEQRQDVSAHAEIVCLRQASQGLDTWRLLETTLYVSLEPCVMCAGAIVHARVKRLVVGASDPKGGGESLYQIFTNCQLNHKVDYALMPHTPSINLLKQFFKRFSGSSRSLLCNTYKPSTGNPIIYINETRPARQNIIKCVSFQQTISGSTFK